MKIVAFIVCLFLLNIIWCLNTKLSHFKFQLLLEEIRGLLVNHFAAPLHFNQRMRLKLCVGKVNLPLLHLDLADGRVDSVEGWVYKIKT
jgi:hypothetical protein